MNIVPLSLKKNRINTPARIETRGQYIYVLRTDCPLAIQLAGQADIIPTFAGCVIPPAPYIDVFHPFTPGAAQFVFIDHCDAIMRPDIPWITGAIARRTSQFAPVDAIVEVTPPSPEWSVLISGISWSIEGANNSEILVVHGIFGVDGLVVWGVSAPPGYGFRTFAKPFISEPGNRFNIVATNNGDNRTLNLEGWAYIYSPSI